MLFHDFFKVIKSELGSSLPSSPTPSHQTTGRANSERGAGRSRGAPGQVGVPARLTRVRRGAQAARGGGCQSPRGTGKAGQPPHHHSRCFRPPRDLSGRDVGWPRKAWSHFSSSLTNGFLVTPLSPALPFWQPQVNGTMELI